MMPKELKRHVDENGEPSCGQPMEGHYQALIAAIVIAGAGFDCSGVYHALVEIAETYRIAGNFVPYEAQQDGFIGATTQAIQERLALNDARENRSHGHDAVIDADFVSYERSDDPPTQPTEPDVQRAYDSLTTDQKKRFN